MLAEARAREEGHLHQALLAGWSALEQGEGAIEAAVRAVEAMENSGVFNAGYGAVPTSAGAIETDAAVMGTELAGEEWIERAAGLCAMSWPANPVRVAQRAAYDTETTLVAGAGADHFAMSAGLPQRDPDRLTYGKPQPTSEVGTVGAVAIDQHGQLATATSTGGMKGQIPGRVGDSPILGAGTWAQHRLVALSCTGHGEAFVLAGFGHRMDMLLRSGVALGEAVSICLDRVETCGGRGGVVMVAPGPEEGQVQGLAACDTASMAWGWRSAEGSFAELLVNE